MTTVFQADQKRELVAILRPLQAATGRDWPPEQWTLWVRALADLPSDAVKRAVARCVQTAETAWPTPAMVRRFASEYLHGALPTAGEGFD